jgi:hypothetical protein
MGIGVASKFVAGAALAAGVGVAAAAYADWYNNDPGWAPIGGGKNAPAQEPAADGTWTTSTATNTLGTLKATTQKQATAGTWPAPTYAPKG